MTMPTYVVIESPFAGDIEANIHYARAAMADSITRGEVPLASHLLYPQVLCDNDRAERELGIALGQAWLVVADIQAFYTDRGWSPGMLRALYMGRRIYVKQEFRAIQGIPIMPAEGDQGHA